MTDAAEDRRDSLGADEAREVWLLRLVVGLIQGAALWWLSRSMNDSGSPDWPASQPTLFGPLLLIFGFVPILILGALGRMRARTLIIWAVAATALLGLLGWHDVARQAHDAFASPPWLDFPVVAFSAAALFIIHHLILPADQQRRLIADYPAYFDTAWRAGVQLAMSIAFTGVFWALLALGAGLFSIIGLDFLANLISNDGFNIPVTCLVFATAVHLTDVRDGLIRGVRTVALMLLSWLLPLMTLLASGFLIALPFTGLSGLFETGSAAAMVLSAAAILIVLINTAYQDGRPNNQPPAILKVSVRIAALLLLPLIGIAAWALTLRIGQYGLTPDRIIASACALVGTIHALGYAFAATLGYHRLGRWMQPLERTNLWGAVLAVILIVALFSPLLDPARLSVADQVARLERGAVTADQFDYRFLRFESGKAGEQALARLARSDNADVAERARAAQQAESQYSMPGETSPAQRPVFELSNGATALPEGFDDPVVAGDGRTECIQPGECVAWPTDLDGDGSLDVLVAQRFDVTLWARNDEGAWVKVGSYWPQRCGGGDGPGDARDMLREGLLDPTPSRWPSIRFNDDPNPTAPTMEQGCSLPEVISPAAESSR